MLDRLKAELQQKLHAFRVTSRVNESGINASSVQGQLFISPA